MCHSCGDNVSPNVFLFSRRIFFCSCSCRYRKRYHYFVSVSSRPQTTERLNALRLCGRQFDVVARILFDCFDGNIPCRLSFQVEMPHNLFAIFPFSVTRPPDMVCHIFLLLSPNASTLCSYASIRFHLVDRLNLLLIIESIKSHSTMLICPFIKSKLMRTNSSGRIGEHFSCIRVSNRQPFMSNARKLKNMHYMKYVRFGLLVIETNMKWKRNEMANQIEAKCWTNNWLGNLISLQVNSTICSTHLNWFTPVERYKGKMHARNDFPPVELVHFHWIFYTSTSIDHRRTQKATSIKSFFRFADAR